jgi:biopolymer transport protein ExbB
MTTRSSLGKNIAIIGLLLQLAPLFGLGATVIGMLSAFRTLGSAGVGDPAALSASIGTVLIFTAIGLLLGIIGFFLLATLSFLLDFEPRGFSGCLSLYQFFGF